MSKSQKLTFDEWWRLVIKIWRDHGRTESILETDMRKLYDNGASPLHASDVLLAAQGKDGAA